MKTLSIFSTSIPSNISSISDAANEAAEYLKCNCCSLDENTLFDVKVILNELLNNAVLHGNKEENSKIVRLSAGLTVSGYIFIIVEDEGEGYDYRCLFNRNERPLNISDPCMLSETGRGIMIVNSLCDKIRFNKKGNKVVVLKNISRN